ncbi:MAG: YdcF family protein [Armatimonadia bacterium]
MFFVLSKILGQFILPLSVIFILLLLHAALHRRRRKLSWGLFWAAIVVLYVCATPWCSDLLLMPLEGPYQKPPLPAHADVILVLGGALDLLHSEPGRPEFSQAVDRFIYALTLGKRFPNSTIVFAGGTASLFDHTKTEASLLKGLAVELGLPPERIRVDDRSRNTFENAQEAARILRETGGSNIVLITSAFHMRRSMACLRKVGLEAIPYGVDIRNHRGEANPLGWFPNASRLDDSSAAIREYIGLVVYRLKGYI